MTDPQTEQDIVLKDLDRFLSSSSSSSSSTTTTTTTTTQQQQQQRSLFDKQAMAVPVAAISVLLGVVQRSQAETMMGLQDELKRAADCMLQNHPRQYHVQRSNIALQSGCELFLKYITRTFLELPDFTACKQQILERGERFQMMSLAARDRIAQSAADFVPANSTVLSLGWSRVVAAILQQAAQRGRNFQVILLEGRPDASGAKSAKSYAQETNIPVKVVLDSAMMYYMEQADFVLVGAEGVLENGGVVNKLGTAALAACAKCMGKPFYVAAESYKFARLYPLHQTDLPQDPTSSSVQFVDTTTANETLVIDLHKKKKHEDQQLPAETTESGMETNEDTAEDDYSTTMIQVENPAVDFTHSKYISLLFTDLGVLTPSAVSDELIRLYQ